MIRFLIFIKDFIIEHPTLIKQWILNFGKEARRNPIFIGLLLFVAYKIPTLFFVHKNSQYIANSERSQIEKEVNLALNECGNGTTIARISIGTLYRSENATSFFFDTVRSCDKNLSGLREDGSCDLDVSWLNPAWKEHEDLDAKTIELLNSDTINLGGSYNFTFKDGQPIWLTLFLEDGTLTQQGNIIKVIAPKLFEILENSKRSIKQIGVVKVRHPTYKSIVYLFTMSFWFNEYGEPEINCLQNRGAILRNLAKKQKQQLQ